MQEMLAFGYTNIKKCTKAPKYTIYVEYLMKVKNKVPISREHDTFYILTKHLASFVVLQRTKNLVSRVVSTLFGVYHKVF